MISKCFNFPEDRFEEQYFLRFSIVLIIGEEDLIKEEHKNWLLQKNTSEICDLKRELTVFFPREHEKYQGEEEQRDKKIRGRSVDYQSSSKTIDIKC